MTTATAQANPNLAFIKYWGNAYASTSISSIQISRLSNQLKAKGVSGFDPGTKRLAQRTIEHTGAKIGVWDTVGGVGK